VLMPFFLPPDRCGLFLIPLGGWCDPHSDVAATLGLAILNAGSKREPILRILNMSIDNAESDGTWPSFWWDTRVYATVWAGSFLSRIGALTPRHAGELIAFLAGTANTVLERTLALLLLDKLCGPEVLLARLAADLLDDQNMAGIWSPFPLLLILRDAVPMTIQMMRHHTATMLS
jgi:hypothetical protein